jgi:hypothetical protein
MKLFISYAHEDNNLCESFVFHISQKHDVWSDHLLPIGFDWREFLDNKLEWCDAVIFLITPNSLKSKYCRYEITTASQSGKMIFPVILVRDIHYPPALNDIQRHDLSGSIIQGMPGLLESIGKAKEASDNGIPHGIVQFDAVFDNIEVVDHVDKRIQKASELSERQKNDDADRSSDLLREIPSQVLIGVIVAIIMALLGVAGNAWINRCTNLVPVIGKELRNQTCPEPTLLPFQDFVVVSSKLITNSDVNRRTADAISKGIEEELRRAQISPVLGDLNIIESSNIWIDQETTLADLRKAARRYAQLFNADIVIYGAVSQTQTPIFEPAFYLPQQSPADLLELVEAIDPEALDLHIPIRDGQSDTLSGLLQGMRGFVLGLQLLNSIEEDSDTDLTERINRLGSALEAFRTVPETAEEDFYAISNLYAGNTALQLAILNQIKYEQDNNCIAGRCSEYTPEIITGYLAAWDHYTVAVGSERKDINIRGLIGRGNVHYRLARLERLVSDVNSFFVDNYICATGSSLYEITENGLYVSEINWVQRALIADRCYQQVVSRAEQDSIIQIKGLFGSAQSLEWVGFQLREESFSQMSFELFSSIISIYEQISTENATDYRCFAGFAYGQRAQIRWFSEDETISNITETKDDLQEAIDLLENAPANCDAVSALVQYRNDLVTLGG